MSYRWLYLVVLIAVVSYLRYVSYKRSVRLEKKLDMILAALGVEWSENAEGPVKRLQAVEVESVEKENAR